MAAKLHWDGQRLMLGALELALVKEAPPIATFAEATYQLAGHEPVAVTTPGELAAATNQKVRSECFKAVVAALLAAGVEVDS
ncbi:hypothetical protein [Corallococcus sp. CA047B]|uniref:hypothetical protein n=1 Tax=Corallococcus sp. CA047B TaxID=2316729 RepID=UPI0011C3ECA9|nr:hypothetical protein [Corallococcus sp. CA047B]